jgi:hypothetical protein
MSEPKSRRELALLAAGGLVGSALATTIVRSASADQPKMERALELLRDAHQVLEEAAADKGGYRAQALKTIETAIEQVEAGMRYAADHW